MSYQIDNIINMILEIKFNKKIMNKFTFIFLYESLHIYVENLFEMINIIFHCYNIYDLIILC
jgi:hypothetical protein